MSRTLLRMLIIALLMFPIWGPSIRLQGFLATTVNHQAKKVTVEVTFDGLMVFRKVKPDHYEVGILDKNTATDHEFHVVVGGKEFTPTEIYKFISPGKDGKAKNWRLEVLTSSGQPKPHDIHARHVRDCNRLQDTELEDVNHVFDFCWIMDLEKEFNGNQEFKLKEGKLIPIIELNNGELFTKFKYDQLNRKRRPSGTSHDFGFVAETIAIQVELEEDESLVLTGGGGEVFRLSGKGPRQAGIFNAPPPMKKYKMGDQSHFPFYYELFEKPTTGTGVGDDIEAKQGGRRPMNRYYPYIDARDRKKRALDDQIRFFTFDRQACGAALLGKSTDPLK